MVLMYLAGKSSFKFCSDCTHFLIERGGGVISQEGQVWSEVEVLEEV